MCTWKTVTTSSVLRSGSVQFLDNNGPQLAANWLQLCLHIYITGLNHLGLVHLSPVVVHQPISTSPIKDQLGPVAVSPGIGLNWSYNTKSTLLTNFYYVLNKTNHPASRCSQQWQVAKWTKKENIKKNKKGPLSPCWPLCCSLSLHHHCPCVIVVPMSLLSPCCCCIVVVPALLSLCSWLSLCCHPCHLFIIPAVLSSSTLFAHHLHCSLSPSCPCHLLLVGVVVHHQHLHLPLQAVACRWVGSAVMWC